MPKQLLFILFLISGILSSELPVNGQSLRAPVRITQSIDDGRLQTLRGNVHPMARAEFDQGGAPADLPMEHMLLVLTRSAAQETALKNLMQQQQDKSSTQYHKWLTPQQFGEQFGAADQDIQTVTAWLQSQGFTVNRVSKGKTVIDFSGTAGQVAQAFHTEIHKYVVKGQSHWANTSDPAIPAALTPVVGGVATLHNFYKKPQLMQANQQVEFTHTPGEKPKYTVSAGSEYALAPADFAAIYNINPLYQEGINGSGTTIAVVAQSNINVSDVISFRSSFDLSANDPQIIVNPNSTNPGRVSGDDEEAVLDTSWAGAIAPNATVDLVVSASTNSTSGVDLSELYIVDSNLADVMTESYGDCEADGYSQSDADYYSSLAQQAAAEGITYTVAAGDSGAEGCDDPDSETTATGPVSINILAATPYNVAVGGTMFNENGNYSTYWNSSNAASGGSALSYIPEDVWNESCTVAQCGPPMRVFGREAVARARSFQKPAWQTGIAGIPADGVRDVPDVSLTAAGHDFYLLCFGGSCTSRRGRSFFSGVSGTSAPTPSFAGIMALVVQADGRQGQANYILYPLAAAETLGNCNASNTAVLPLSNCIFNDVTLGNNDVPGEIDYGSANADYQATFGYDLTTGLGSVNVANLVNNWSSSISVPSSSPFQITITQPSALNSTFIGLAAFSGSASNDNSAIASVEISIDNVPYGAASFNAGGWSIAVDTTQIADGTHTLDVTATTVAGDHGSASAQFTVANWSGSDPMIVNIDSPGVNSSAFSSVVGFGGWAIDSAGSISSVAIAIDGVPEGNASYGSKRSDVCAAYPRRAGCPNVGWNFVLDTTAFADGTHTVAVTGFTAAGQNTTVSRAFTTANLTGNPINTNIDNPGPNNPSFSGAASFYGWALDSTLGVAISTVGVSVDGVFIRNATYGSARADVCNVFPSRAGCPDVGWSVVIDTTTLANGVHKLDVEATTATGQHGTQSATFTVANTTSGSPIVVNIDAPGSRNSVVTGLSTAAGWAIDTNETIASVSIAIDGAPLGNATYNISRPDVCAAYPLAKNCPVAGWTLPFDSTLIPDGTHTLAATATSSSGVALTASSTFTVANWTTGNPMRINIDNPNSSSGNLSGRAGFGGWAISDIAAISRVSLAIDGIPFGNAAYGGNRSDVCAAYPGRPGCPNVGWNFPLDTTMLANGTHTLAVTATSSGGQGSTVSTTFTVSNTGGPVYVNIDAPAVNAFGNGQITLAGWALDTTSGVGIATVEILMDGVFLYDASYGPGNGARPDVCAAFPGAVGCPYLEWKSTLDTTLFAPGRHVLEVRAISTTGQQATGSQFFTITPQ